MSEILTNNKYYKDIADTIRQMKGVATTYKPREMAGALREMYSTEVEGVPPLTFPSNGNNLLNYRIDGANGGVGDRTKNLANSNEIIQGYWAYADGGFVYTNTWICTPKIACKGNVDYTFQFANNSRWYGFVWYDENNNFISTTNQQNNLQTGFHSFTAKSPSNAGYLVINIAGYPGTNDTIRTDDLINFQLKESSTVTDYEPYGYKIPVIINGKNLLDYNWLFDYEQKKVNEYFNYIQITLEPNTTYNVTSDYNYNQAQNATAFIVVNSNTAITTANGGVFRSLTVTTTQDGILKIARRIKGNNETMVPKREDFENNSKHIQISINSVNDDNYEPYIEPTTTNIYLDEPIEANESKSLSDTNVNIPTINGTNILSIDTTIQPSNVYVQAPKTNNYNL